jgi:hypothetical protein
MIYELLLVSLEMSLGMYNLLAHPTLMQVLSLLQICSNDRVSKRGDELLKRKANGANLEDMMLIKRLFAIYQGAKSTSYKLPDNVWFLACLLACSLICAVGHTIKMLRFVFCIWKIVVGGQNAGK